MAAKPQESTGKVKRSLGREIPPQYKEVIYGRLEKEEFEIQQEMQRARRNFRGEMADGESYGLNNHPAGSATHASPAAAQTQLINNCEKRLAKIRQARVRVEAGSYGLCIICGEEIPVIRLEKVPYADKCVKCKGEETHHSKRRRR